MALFQEAVDLSRYWLLLSPILALALNVAGQVILFRARRGDHFLRSILEGFLAGACGLALFEIFGDHEGIASHVVNGLTYGALSYCYFHLACLGQSSIRIRIYSEVAATDRGLSLEEIGQVYDERALAKIRFRRLIESGDIIERDGRYFIGRKRLIYIANIISMIKRGIVGKASQFDFDAI